MAQVNGECCILLPNGSSCRRAARFTCDNWHLICASHRKGEETQAFEEGCPVCSGPLVQFSVIEEGLSNPRRRKSDFSLAIGTFLREAAARWFPEFNNRPETKEQQRSSDDR